MRIIAIVLMSLLLIGCATTTPEPPATEKCIIPDALMVKQTHLPLIVADKSGTVTLDELFKIWFDDVGKYNDLNTKDNALVDWVAKYCQAAPLSTTITTPQATPISPSKPSLFGG